MDLLLSVSAAGTAAVITVTGMWVQRALHCIGPEGGGLKEEEEDRGACKQWNIGHGHGHGHSSSSISISLHSIPSILTFSHAFYSHPIDVVKTRLQVSGEGTRNYKALGIGGTVKVIAKEEGVTAFWKGIGKCWCMD
jgi:hypothetical protein